MYFLETIDLIHVLERNKYNIPKQRKDFSSYIPLEITDGCKTCRFTIMKGDKAKLQIVSGKQRVYLSDIQIIETILKMPTDDLQWFLRQFVLLYQEHGTQMWFTIKQTPFEGMGIAAYPVEKHLLLLSDTIIDYSCFCFFLSYIFFKDKCYEEMSKKELFSKQTLCKFISTIDYYANHSKRSEAFLNAIGYPINDDVREAEAEISRILKKTENIKKFDISAYL